jgi:coproporphyrinogen III oxidase
VVGVYGQGGGGDGGAVVQSGGAIDESAGVHFEVVFGVDAE